MDELLTCEIITERMNAQLGALTDVVPGDASRVIENECRSFLRRQIAMTPPRTQAQGEAAIERDFNKIFTPVNEEFLNMIGSQFGVAGIDTWITNSDGGKDHLLWDRIDPSGSGMDAFHRANQNRRGRTRNLKKSRGDAWYSPYVVSFADFASYLAKIQSHVGRRKAAWAKSFKKVGGTVAGWIERHISDAPGEVYDDLQNRTRPSITMINRAPGIADDMRIFNDNIRISANSIRKKLQLLIKGYAYDMATGRVISPKEMREAA